MTTRKVINRNNYKEDPGRIIPGKSMTIEDTQPSLAELLRRAAMGGDLTEREGTYVDDADEDDIDGQEFAQMDPVDQGNVLEGIRAMTQRLKDLEQEYADAVKTRNRLEEQAQNQKETPEPPK